MMTNQAKKKGMVARTILKHTLYGTKYPSLFNPCSSDI
jgi:hypothetical protein